MTWVIATPTVFGYAAGISDIRVTFRDRRTVDCLQKIHPVGRVVAAGFAGSVRFGLLSIADLVQQLDVADAERAWVPEWVAFKWHRRARWAFGRLEDEEQALGSQIILLGVSPTADMAPGISRPAVAVLKSPGFEPQIVTRECWGAIGSGTDVDLYMSRLDLTPQLQNLDTAGLGGFMAAFTYIIHRTIDEHRSALVSPYVHLCMVQRSGIVIRNSDHMTVSASGDRAEVRMPPVVRTLEQFEHLCRSNRLSAAAATG